MESIARRRWPSEAAIRNAVEAVKFSCGDVSRVRVNEDGSFDIWTNEAENEKSKESVADKIKRFAG